MKRFLLQIMLLSLTAISFSTPAQADETLFKCANGSLALINKFNTSIYGKRSDSGLFLFIFGPVAQGLQERQLYPTNLVPGSHTEGLYWNPAVQYPGGDVSTDVRMANVTGPFFRYYFKRKGPSTAELEIWKLSTLNSRSINIQSGDQLVHRLWFNDCQP